MSGSKHSARAADILARLDREGQLIADIGSGRAPYLGGLKGRLIRMDITNSELQDVVGSLDSLPFGANLFEGVICFQVLYYTGRPEKWIAEIGRILKPGGWVAWSVSKPGGVRTEKGYSSQTMADWPGEKWDRAFRLAGFKTATPAKARLIWNKLGVYHFGVCWKNE